MPAKKIVATVKAGANEPQAELSSTINEIVSANPGFLVSKGTEAIFLIVVLLIAVTWFIKYPDTVFSYAKLSTINAPKPLVPKETGKLIKLIAKNNQQVQQNEIIGWMESPADALEVFKLEKKIDTLLKALTVAGTDFLKSAPEVKNSSFSKIGELQSGYQAFIQAYTMYLNYIGKGFYVKKRAMLLADIANLEKGKSNLLQEKELYKQDMDMSRSTFEANEKLFKSKMISDQEYRELMSRLISKKITLPQIQSSIISNEAQQNEKKKDILELDNQIAGQKTVFLEAVNNLKNQVEDWKQKYLLIAPITGQLTFVTFLQENQQLQINQPIAYITPSNSSYYMQLSIPQGNFGKVATGQKVLLKFPSYQWQEFGSIEGRIDYIFPIPADTGGYIARVSLPHGLQTSHHKAITYHEGLVATAEIVIKDQRLLERFYYSIVHNINK